MTSGWRIEWPPLAIVAAVGILVTVLNVTSAIMEAQTGGPPVDSLEVWLYEVSSVVMVLALTPLAGWMLWKVPPRVDLTVAGWARFAGMHLAAACVFSLLHVAGMVALRTAGYASVGLQYDFAYRGDLLLPFLYEFRKDLLTYFALAAAYWTWGFWQAQRAAQAMIAEPVKPVRDDRIEIRDGGRVTLLDPASISWVEAAGNYVEIHAGGVTHLVRGTLSAFEERLAPHGFARIHRSRIVNKARISAFKSTASGDIEITLDDGGTVGGSRRFRAALE